MFINALLIIMLQEINVKFAKVLVLFVITKAFAFNANQEIIGISILRQMVNVGLVVIRIVKFAQNNIIVNNVIIHIRFQKVGVYIKSNINGYVYMDIIIMVYNV